MSSVVAIDPGAYWTGVAVFDAGTKRLLRATRVRGIGFRRELWTLLDTARDVARIVSGFTPVSELVLEWPQVYKQRGKKDPNDLLPLAGLDCMLLPLIDPYMVDGAGCTLYRPHDWKGSKGANPTARSIVERLDEFEKLQVEEFPEFLKALDAAEAADKEVSHGCHNTLDAVGIGLKWLRRFEKRRVIHR